MKFVVVIILDDREAMLQRQLRQPNAPCLRHDNRRRKLMVRRQEYRAYPLMLQQRLQCVDVESVLVQWHG